MTICSGCTKIKLIKLRACSTDLPKLVILMNSFIHMSSSLHLARNMKMTGLFWTIFSNFSNFGEPARLFLLQTRCLGRLIDQFLNHFNSNDPNFFGKEKCYLFKQKFKDQTLQDYVPFVVYSKEFYIGMDAERSQVQMTMNERK